MYGDFVKLSSLVLLDAYAIPLGIGITYPVILPIETTISGYNEIVGTCRADQNGTLFIYQYGRPQEIAYTTTLIVLANVTLAFSIKVIAPVYNFQYTNGAIAQGVFQLRIYGKTIG